MPTRTLTATVPADVAAQVDAYAESTHQTASDVAAQVIGRWAEWEAEKLRLTLEAAADCEAGNVIDDAEVAAWIESLDTDQPIPRPQRPR